MKATLTIPNHKPVSWNAIYENKHWRVRKQIVDDIHLLVWEHANGQEIPLFQTLVDIKITAGKKDHILDSDNIFAKGYVDGLRGCGVLLDDNPKYVRRVTTESVKSESNWVEIEITDVIQSPET